MSIFKSHSHMKDHWKMTTIRASYESASNTGKSAWLKYDLERCGNYDGVWYDVSQEIKNTRLRVSHYGHPISNLRVHNASYARLVIKQLDKSFELVGHGDHFILDRCTHKNPFILDLWLSDALILETDGDLLTFDRLCMNIDVLKALARIMIEKRVHFDDK